MILHIICVVIFTASYEQLFYFLQFLCRLNIMDYSLLVGIHKFEHEDSESEDEVAIESQDDSGEDLESPNEAYGTAESAGDSPTSTPPGTPPGPPPSTPPPDMPTPSTRPVSYTTLTLPTNKIL